MSYYQAVKAVEINALELYESTWIDLKNMPVQISFPKLWGPDVFQDLFFFVVAFFFFISERHIFIFW